MSDLIHEEPLADGQSDPQPVWSKLRAAREARGLSQSQVSAHLKLTVRQIEAIEKGDLSELPGATFARGFVRNYARFLGLDAAEFLAAAEQEPVVSHLDARPQMVSPDLGRMPSVSNPRYSAVPAALLVLLLAVVLGAGWHYGWFESRDDLVLLGSDVSSQSLVTSDVSATESAPSVEASVPVGQMSAPLAEQSAVEQGAPASAVVPVPPAPQANSVAGAVPVAPQSAASDLPRMVFSFEGDSWVEVRDASGQIVFSRLNQAGSVQEVQGQPPFALVIGNAAAVKLSWKGQSVDLAPTTKGNVAYPSLK